MSSTTVQEDAPHTITLTNGKTFTFNSNASTTDEQIPVIDVSRMYSEKFEDRQAVAEEIREAAHVIGFLSIVNHGVDMKLAEGVMEQAKSFFALPNDKKMKVCTDLVPDEYCGYHPMHHYNPNCLLKRDLYEAYNWNYNAANDPDYPDDSIPEINIWPDDRPEFRKTLCAYQSEMIRFARRLTRMFALALHLPEDSFDIAVQRPEAGARILHYPQQEASRDDQNGIGAHTDVEYFTIITADTEGLEVLSKSGQWIKVKPIAGSFIVNIADCFMRQTNDFFVSTVHRVINESGRERYSVPFFWGFNRQTVIDPIPTCVSKENPNKYPVMTAGEYYLWRTRRQKTMWKTGENQSKVNVV
ncbi:putative gibberellin 3-beta hydroxylase [Exophiala viscosa]|uniref:Gibberellin 3-beta hydroxylase n=1 Tax=Exophiala viscosa TaxID=2486360 RepID=A0AAN6E624_9EURO|nr:putative gibberellin 3-beta hydroxylase [Exophiala viscosa]